MKTNQLRPLHDQCVIRRMPYDDTTAGGLFLPDVARAGEHKAPRGRGTVFAVGPGKLVTKPDPHDPEPDRAKKRRVPTGEREEMVVKFGDEVVFSRYSGDEVAVDDEKDIVLVAQEHILAVLDPD